MGFFGENGSVGKEFSVAEDGPYNCRLKEVILCEGKVFEAGKLPKPQFRFNFVSLDETDDEGEPYRFSCFTGRSYGDDRADLTKLIDGMKGRRLTPEEFLELDLDDFTTKKWRVIVTTQNNAQGKPYNKIVSVKPVQPVRGTVASRPTPTKTIEPDDTDTEGLVDPFDD